MQKPFFRRSLARKIREEAAEIAFLRPHAEQLNNGSEAAFPTYIANHTKGLPHNQLGEVEPGAYQSLLKALCSGKPEDFEQIPRGCSSSAKLDLPENILSAAAKQESKDQLKPQEEYSAQSDFVEVEKGRRRRIGCRRFVNPQAGLAFDLEGPDAQSVTVPPAPRIDEAENSCEAIELYWMALLRDVNFSDFPKDKLVARATKELSDCSVFFGPKEKGKVTEKNIFRGITPGDLTGPYVSQFLLRDVRFGTLTTPQRQRTVVAGKDFMTDYKEWLAVQDGFDLGGRDVFDKTPRYIRNMRDLGNYVHFDELFQAYLNAVLILLDMKAPFDVGNPYNFSVNQAGIGTYGPG